MERISCTPRENYREIVEKQGFGFHESYWMEDACYCFTSAEIEKEEWTLRKEFTDKLEALYKAYQEDSSNEIAIEAGKLVCHELLKNTDDRSGLIKSVK